MYKQHDYVLENNWKWAAWRNR